MEENRNHTLKLKEFLIQELSAIDDVIINSEIQKASPYITNICFEDIKSEVLIHYLEQDKIYVSSGSACKKDRKSRVLEGINTPNEYIEGCIRISFSDTTKRDEVTVFIEKLKAAVSDIRTIIRRK